MRTALAGSLALAIACAAPSGPRRPLAPAASPKSGASANAAAPAGARTKWVGTWITAPQLTEPGNLPPAPGLWGNTLRQVVHVSLGGSRLRLSFSNQYGSRPYTLARVEVAVSRGRDAMDPSSVRTLAFAGAPSARVEPGKTATSDPFDFALAPLSELAVTVLTGEDGPSEHTGHPGSRTTSYLAAGDETGAPALPAAVPATHWYLLSGIDVLAEPNGAAVVTLGDSITDGRGSTTDGNDRWPDALARRLQADPRTKHVAVLNQGIGGNAVLAGGLGPTALERFERDVLAPSGVRYLVLFEGVNDIGASTDQGIAARLIAAYGDLVTRAKATGILVYGATILPFGGSQYDSPEHEAARAEVNAWIRTSGRFDAVVDFDQAVRDPDSPSKLAAHFDTGDHLHLNPDGYRRLAESIDLALFTR